MTPEDDFDPDAHPPIKRTHCLALTWFDNDPMPAVCRREPHDDGQHTANRFGGATRIEGPRVEWLETVVQTEREAS